MPKPWETTFPASFTTRPNVANLNYPMLAIGYFSATPSRVRNVIKSIEEESDTLGWTFDLDFSGE
jgi:hypothetical protein